MQEHETGQDRFSALRYLASQCGPKGGEALAREFLTMRAVRDTVLLNQTVRGLVSLRDASILAAATEVATDGSATFEARVAGLRIIVSQAHPGYRVGFQDFAPRDEGMLVAINHVQIVRPSGPDSPNFPADWKERTDEALSRIMEDPAESEAMQWAADRGLFFLRSLGPE